MNCWHGSGAGRLPNWVCAGHARPSAGAAPPPPQPACLHHRAHGRPLRNLVALAWQRRVVRDAPGGRGQWRGGGGKRLVSMRRGGHTRRARPGGRAQAGGRDAMAVPSPGQVRRRRNHRKLGLKRAGIAGHCHAREVLGNVAHGRRAHNGATQLLDLLQQGSRQPHTPGVNARRAQGSGRRCRGATSQAGMGAPRASRGVEPPFPSTLPPIHLGQQVHKLAGAAPEQVALRLLVLGGCLDLRAARGGGGVGGGRGREGTASVRRRRGCERRPAGALALSDAHCAAQRSTYLARQVQH